MTARLYLGTARYSSWSMRGWLLVRLAGLAAETLFRPLGEAKSVSPSGLVPYLEHEGARVWESLAIAEYCADLNPALWPASRPAKAWARSIAAEMHAGFRGLRQAMPMNLGRPDYAGLGQTPESLADLARIEEIWTETRAGFGAGGPFLFGAAFNAADAMYAPVVARLLTYAPPLSAASREYCAAVRAHPLVAEWYEFAAKEPSSWRMEKFECLA
ncbi:glutathione S-transferase [Acidocella sp.]|uniref:glutathione S-transferase n=1 Tax=Acidocella sp. TaxID=50710 RepID=UPI002634AAEB|nr:glutathione S-transferase [Acidocella sp.]